MFTNSLGFRDREIREVPLETDKHRIVFIGDSFTEGVMVPYDETFVGIVDRRLGAAYDVLNAAVVSYGAINYYDKIEYLINHAGLKFDELFVFSDISDVYNDYSLHHLEHFSPHMSIPFFVDAAIQADHFFRDYSYFYHSFSIIYPYVKLRKFERAFPW